MIKDIISHINCMLGCLENYIAIENSQGFTDINVACENLILGMMNIVYDYNLENYNSKKHIANAKGIDLIDNKRKICVQVSSNHKITKLKDTIENIKKIEYLNDYHLFFFALVNKANNLRNYKPDNEESLKFKFNANKDIIDFHSFSLDIERMSEYKKHALNAFLRCWLGEEYYNPVLFKDKIDNRNQQDSFDRPKDYYQRKISIASNNDFSIEKYIHPEKYKPRRLIEYIKNKILDYTSQYWLLIAAGQTGKSYEVKNLAFLLNQTDDIFPVIFEAKFFKDGNKEINIPFYYSDEHIVFIIDGIDEISGEELRESFYYRISDLKSKHPELRILMTCRRNYIDNTKFKEFKRLFLNDLSYAEIKEIVNNSDICTPDDFLNKIEDKTLYPIAGNPFFLKAMIMYYKEKNEIQENRLELYRYLIKCSYSTENEKNKGKLIQKQTYGDTLLKKIALALQFTERKSLSEAELKGKMGFNDSQIELCMSFAIFHRDESHNYSFELNSFLMYYVVDFLMNKSYETILNLISYNKHDVPRIRPEWYDVFELLLSSMTIGDERREYLLEWTFENDIEALLNVDPNSLEDEFKDKIFKAILLIYKEKQITSSPNMGIDFSRKLASLCTTAESLQFFITEYKNEKELGPYLYLLSFVYWFINSDYIELYEYTEDFKKSAFNYLKEFGNIKDSKWYEILYAPLHNDIFLNKEDIEKLIDLTNDVDDIELKICIFRLIEETDLCDDFFYFTISNESNIKDYKREGDYGTHMVDRNSVIYALTHIKNYDNIKRLWTEYPHFIKDDYRYNEDEIQHKFRCDILKLAEAHISKHFDIVEDIKQAWINECEKKYLAYSSNTVITDFRDFFIRNKLCDNLSDLCEDLYIALQDEKCKNKTLDRLYAEIILIITVEGINKLAEQWDGDDIYRCKLMSWLRNTPLPEINSVVSEWINNKFVQAKSPYENMPTFEQMNLERLVLIFNRELFKYTIYRIIDKFAPTNGKDLRFKINEDDELQINNYVMLYLSKYIDKKSGNYDTKLIKESLENDTDYHCFIIDITLQNYKVQFSKDQKGIIENSLKYLIHHRDSIYHFEKVIELILKFNFDIDKDIIIELLPYAGISYCMDSQKGEYIYFIDYANKKLGTNIIKQYLPKLVSHDFNKHRELDLIKISELIVQLKMKELYPEICKQITKTNYYGEKLVDILLDDKEFGIITLKSKLGLFNTNIQIYILDQLYKIDLHQSWVLHKTIELRPDFSEEDNKRALLLLLRLGYDQALDECIEYLSKDIKSLGNPFMAPTLNYTDIKYLSKILTLLRIVWDCTEPFNNWSSRIKETLIRMAEKNLEQYNAVNASLCKMKNEEEKYISNLSYFIDELKKFDPRLKDAPISIAKALEIIDKYNN